MDLLINFKIIDGNHKGELFSVTEPMVCFVGSADDCTFMLKKDHCLGLSAHHAVIDISPPRIVIKDLNSTNGTLVNGVPIKNHLAGIQLRNHDEIVLGKTVIIAEISDKHGQWTENILNQESSGRVKITEEHLLKDFLPQLDNYHLIKELGRGGSGIVYLAYDLQRKEKVALKMLKSEFVARPDIEELFKRETAYSRQLNHPHIVKLLDSGKQNNHYFFTSEYCNGGDLEKLIRQKKFLKLDVAADIIIQLISALDYAHHAKVLNYVQEDGLVSEQIGIVHRDIKPGNVLLATRGDNTQVAKIADFGLAKSFEAAGLSGLTQTGSYCGTPEFMSRPQIVNYKYSRPEVDVWSLAALFYYLLCGQPPRKCGGKTNPMLAVMNSKPTPLHSQNKEIPNEICDFLDIALDDQRRLRYKTIASFKGDLLTVLQMVGKLK